MIVSKKMRDIVDEDYTRILIKDKNGNPLPSKIVSSHGEIKLELVNNKMTPQNFHGLHISLHPISFVKDARNIKLSKIKIDEISNELEKFHSYKKKQKNKKRAGIMPELLDSLNKKYT